MLHKFKTVNGTTPWLASGEREGLKEKRQDYFYIKTFQTEIVKGGEKSRKYREKFVEKLLS